VPKGRFYSPESTEKLFWEKVDKTGSCWLWTGLLSDEGYGRFHVNRVGIPAHVYSYELHVGSVPDGMILRHTCDVRRCIRPDHLVPGTQKQNIADAVERGRHVQGETHGMTELTEVQVLEMRKLFKLKVPAKVLAAMFKVSRYTVYDIVKRKTWKCVP